MLKLDLFFNFTLILNFSIINQFQKEVYLGLQVYLFIKVINFLQIYLFQKEVYFSLHSYSFNYYLIEFFIFNLIIVDIY